MSSELDVSLEPQLLESLQPICPELPSELKALLQPFLGDPPAKKIPYNIVLRISQWARTPAGQKSLQHVHHDASEYSMISLLAGTTTSPDKKFPAYTPPEDPLLGALRQKRERKAITTVINGVVSVLGTGIGVWWISDKTGYKDEWRVLLAFSAAIIVALSEIILFIIWQSKSSVPKRSFRPENKRDQSEAIELPRTPTGVSNAIEDRAVDLRERIKHSST